MEKIKHILKGVFISYITTIVFLLIFSLLLVKTNIKEQYINTIIMIVSSISILIGTTISTIKLKKYGIINGVIISTIYTAVLYIISSVFNNDFSINTSTVIIILFGEILGVLGGIIGVNIKS